MLANQRSRICDRAVPRSAFRRRRAGPHKHSMVFRAHSHVVGGVKQFSEEQKVLKRNGVRWGMPSRLVRRNADGHVPVLLEHAFRLRSQLAIRPEMLVDIRGPWIWRRADTVRVIVNLKASQVIAAVRPRLSRRGTRPDRATRTCLAALLHPASTKSSRFASRNSSISSSIESTSSGGRAASLPVWCSAGRSVT